MLPGSDFRFIDPHQVFHMVARDGPGVAGGDAALHQGDGQVVFRAQAFFPGFPTGKGSTKAILLQYVPFWIIL